MSEVTIVQLRYEKDGTKLPIPIYACEVGQWTDWMLSGDEENPTQVIKEKFGEHEELGAWVKEAISQGASFGLAERWVGTYNCVLLQHHNRETLEDLLIKYFALYNVKPIFKYFP